mmetsp:Transcript_15532/g.40250  ORF Transcript_15532/g.40250 Transcript_15532/m.40250 type:complete len:92 (+) Transcript_15532:32-307(+)|eukprot:CAMPEP_0182919572 /NCGR_PEP_ID=MMETSP0105_2-20130417/2830_1 /TAXON_ID=81532 ORGANISM="Acanthoeca-like sp., Strain 10tr" /NCGR_SAMPLE_ID=MMETSP0105_2 /ASSEMBLY_ACC=CAM_ASM_000205 /LENGTH=91 /DNA_ID=CAMNT_0025056785 /DNA_START=31 /DNA_END=306 /DNA_ORIENTATION=-
MSSKRTVQQAAVLEATGAVVDGVLTDAALDTLLPSEGFATFTASSIRDTASTASQGPEKRQRKDHLPLDRPPVPPSASVAAAVAGQPRGAD